MYLVTPFHILIVIKLAHNETTLLIKHPYISMRQKKITSFVTNLT